MAFDETDRDMKIAGSRPSLDMKPKEDSVTADILFAEKESGMLLKAQRLGRQLLPMMLDSADFAYDDGNADAYNKRILLCFSVISSIEDGIADENVGNVVLNSFLDAIKSEDERLYNDICSAGELSFYYLALKRSEEKAQAIGSVFAMICGKEDNQEYISRGAEIYNTFSSDTMERIKSMQL